MGLLPPVGTMSNYKRCINLKVKLTIQTYLTLSFYCNLKIFTLRPLKIMNEFLFSTKRNNQACFSPLSFSHSSYSATKY